MSGTYLIFKRDDTEALCFVEVVEGLEFVRKRLMQLTESQPGSYLVYDPTNARFEEPFKKSA